MSILIKGVRLEQEQVDVFIEDSWIKAVGPNLNFSAQKIIDGQNKAICPSLANVHTHAAMTLLRGYADDLELHTWLNDYIWPFEQKLGFKDIYIGTKLACLEMIKTGTTFFCDMYWHPLAARQAVEEMGIRAAISSVFVDFGSASKAKEFKRKIEEFFAQNQNGELVQFVLGPHAIYTVSKESLIWLKEFALANDLLIHIHLAETQKEVEDCQKEHGLTPVRYLDSLGFFEAKVLAAHVVWVDEEELEILQKQQVKIAHVPVSNLKLASGIAPVDRFVQKQMNLGLGTDGCASNNNLNLFEEIKLAALLAKVRAKDPALLKAKEAFDLAARNGFDFFGIKAGEIMPGFKADLLLVDLLDLSMLPDHDFYSNLVYASQGRCIDTVICNGKVLMENKKVPGEEDILAQAKMCVSEILKRI